MTAEGYPYFDGDPAGAEYDHFQTLQEYVRAGNLKYYSLLKDFGIKYNHGFESITVDATGLTSKYHADGQCVGAEFTGAGLCVVASYILAQWLSPKFPDFEFSLCEFKTDFSAENWFDPHRKLNTKIHVIVECLDKNRSQSLYLDPTYRQINSARDRIIAVILPSQLNEHYRRWRFTIFPITASERNEPEIYFAVYFNGYPDMVADAKNIVSILHTLPAPNDRSSPFRCP